MGTKSISFPIILAAILIVIIHVISAVYHERDSFSVNAASRYLIEHAYEKSHNRCAWHIMCAMNAGGQPVPLLRACDYKWYFRGFLDTQFYEVPSENYIPEKGDIVVFPKVKNHPYGHIAMWTGEQWVSDFKQNNIIVAKEYSELDCTIFRPIFIRP